MFLASVSTIYDTFENFSFFIEENRIAGVDHFFIFFEKESKEIEKYVEDKNYITFIPTYKLGYTNEKLNKRQTINANLINKYLADFNQENIWLTHIDGDEVLYFDKEELRKIDQNIIALKVHPHESIAQLGEGSQKRSESLFKRKLWQNGLSLAYTLKLIEQPSMEYWFRGYFNHKSIVRPSNEYDLGIHYLKCPENMQQVLKGAIIKHYDSLSEFEFIRKWEAKRKNSSGNTGIGKTGSHLRNSIDYINNLNMSDQEKNILLAELYKKSVVEKDIETKKRYNLITNLPSKRNNLSNVHFDFDQIKIEKKYLNQVNKA